VIRFWILAVAILWAAPSRADDLRPGYLSLTQVDTIHWRIIWRAPIKGGLASHAAPVLPPRCTLDPPQTMIRTDFVERKQGATCPEGLVGQKLGLSGLNAAQSDVLMRIAPLNQPPFTRHLTASTPMVVLPKIPERFDVATTYTTLGIWHILLGFDHLLFVFALVLLVQRGWPILKTVTAFTLAHSITLAATALNLVSVPRRPVEICIALSILFVAVEILNRRSGDKHIAQRWPWLVAFVFGLLHGFGFAGALAEIGLPHGEVPTALLTFNIGVEIGQIAIVASSLLVLAGVRHFAPALFDRAVTLSAYAVGSIASYWMILRAFV
jgi:hydrogenase/urease accessory protein HupE